MASRSASATTPAATISLASTRTSASNSLATSVTLVVDGVQTDQVAQGERAHGVVAAVDHAGVDLRRRGEAGLDHPDRGEQVGHQQGVDQEACPVLAVHDVFVELPDAERLGPRHGLGRVSELGTSSTCRSTGTGLKKCTPITRCGWGVTAASFMIGIDEVLLASSASGRATLPSARKIAIFSASSSTTASTTRSR